MLTQIVPHKVDPVVTPVICPPINQPVAIRDRLEHKLEDMESLGVIKKVEGPTNWVNSLVVVEKPKSKSFRSARIQDHYPKGTPSTTNFGRYCHSFVRGQS